MAKNIHIHLGKKARDATSPQLENVKAQLLGVIRDAVAVSKQNPGNTDASSLVQYLRQSQSLAKKIG